ANTTSNPVLSGGAGAKTFALVSGTMPPGVQLDVNTGEISGNPSSDANTSLTIRVSDSTGSAQTTIALR
ncbi:putative Ig domain-containing protein, partial [Klebsiella pneumoniae]|uniref:putative Ig domain-containing protein n=1 Tax=Klebsiella pneumoniae TaxID=573 RepID=UPI00195402EE